jgi:hypothetical protein
MHGRRIHRRWMDQPKMNAASYANTCAMYARRLEDDTSRRFGLRLTEARRLVASETQVPAGTLENLRRGRLKSPAAWIYQRLSAAVCARLEAQIRGLEHELETARALGGRPDDHRIRAAEAALTAARAALEGEGG